MELKKNPTSSLKNIRINFEFKDKKDNMKGLQIADLIAYPIAKYILNQSIKNPAFDIISKKIYQGISKILIA